MNKFNKFKSNLKFPKINKNNFSFKRYITTPNFPTALTFDDVLLVPRLSEVTSRSAINLKTRLTREINLNLPILSSNMDTVTEVKTAIAMATEGGIGIIHRFLSISDQVEMIKQVKRAESAVIQDPYTIGSNSTLYELKQLMNSKGVHSILVTSKDNKLEGIVTSRDLKYLDLNMDDQNEKVSSFMTSREKLITTNPSISLEDAKKIMQKNKIEKLPLVDENFILKGLITGKDLLRSIKSPLAVHDKNGQLMVGGAIGVKKGDVDRAIALVEAGCDVLVLDIAHGHSTLEINMLHTLKKILPGTQIIAGNVATGEGAKALIEAGADAIKVGVGPGSICITRIVTGCGVPQLSAILDCYQVAKFHDVPLIADGGIRNSGDITKALGAGAHTVMLGNLLAGTDESPGTTIVKDGKKVKIIRGMAGYGANLSKRQREEQRDDIFDVVPEGVEAQVAYRGPVKEILRLLAGGLKSGISYCGGNSISDLHKNATFVRITGAGKTESGSHDVHKI
eukprot:TRINITY_DN11825_c0_g1_i1.p1 TRINITY_DN11825_c0_g1~~TRINITY_DN11825_c0_g1_i1.p1  ORF type:complete len:509 (-),score=167.76 TRINITY_DN11825_c0_g1_i1:7-1533(-)